MYTSLLAPIWVLLAFTWLVKSRHTNDIPKIKNSLKILFYWRLELIFLLVNPKTQLWRLVTLLGGYSTFQRTTNFGYFKPLKELLGFMKELLVFWLFKNVVWIKVVNWSSKFWPWLDVYLVWPLMGFWSRTEKSLNIC